MSTEIEFKRRIVCAAIRYPNGTVITGARHFDSVMHAQLKFIPESIKNNVPEQGFIDQRGVYLDRFEALTIAEAANQLIRKTTPVDRLFSEDLY